MSDQKLLKIIVGHYNQLNEDGKFEATCRLNDSDITEHHQALFNQLSEKIRKRYYGTGLNIPEKLEGKRVLDLGCGCGSFVFILSKLVGPSGYVVGVDLSDGLIETAKAESDYHARQWGYDKPNFEFRVGDLEKLDELGFQPNTFDVIVSNGVFSIVPNKVPAFKNTFALLKVGGQFYLNDVNAERAVPKEMHTVGTLWADGVAGALEWHQEEDMIKKTGFTASYMTCANPAIILNEDHNKTLGNRRFACVGRRLFKLPPGARKEASRVTYNGNIPSYPEAFPWDVDLTFKCVSVSAAGSLSKESPGLDYPAPTTDIIYTAINKKGEAVNVDEELATILYFSYFSDSFSFDKVSGRPHTKRIQNPFAYMDKLKDGGKLPEPIYGIL